MTLINAFSANMLPAGQPAVVTFVPITSDVAGRNAAHASGRGELRSAVGHADTARIFSGQLGCEIEAARVSVTLEPGQSALLGQYRGPRLPEGATALPEGAVIDWYFVTVS